SLDIAGLVVGLAGLPAAKDDSLPLVSQCPLGHMSGLPELPLAVVVGLCPAARGDRNTCVLMERLLHKLGRCPARVNVLTAAALTGDWGYPRGSLQSSSILVTPAIITQRGNESRLCLH